MIDVTAPMFAAIDARERDHADVGTFEDEGGGVSVVHDPAGWARDIAKRDAEEAAEARQLEMSGAISLNPTELTKRVAGLQAHTDKIANYAQGLPTRDEYDALLAEAVMVQREVKALTLLVSALTDSVELLMKQNPPRAA